MKCVKFPKISKSKQSTAESDSEEDDRPILPSGKIVPIPKGKSPYALAKNAEYYDKDNVRAEQLYREAILVGDRAESSLKDLASLLHRLGKTSEAIKLLKENRHLVDDDIKKYENLIQTLQN